MRKEYKSEEQVFWFARVGSPPKIFTHGGVVVCDMPPDLITNRAFLEKMLLCDNNEELFTAIKEFIV